MGPLWSGFLLSYSGYRYSGMRYFAIRLFRLLQRAWWVPVSAHSSHHSGGFTLCLGAMR